MEVSKLIELLRIRSLALDRIEQWISLKMTGLFSGYNHSAPRAILGKCKNYTINDLYDNYDRALDELEKEKEPLETEYSLYRFGQGLIEADIFASLYK